ncbi:hyalin isoform X7 [Strongylocentrotus purpuratus]|uniref:Egg receptor for bindin n=1 Tax=Strongylocentrotus purpuratus TaxID=7668 RepID=A0A7M7N9E0_STRPU|nr:hyalin isoform X7 [Strongylocentrotus purpuratus]
MELEIDQFKEVMKEIVDMLYTCDPHNEECCVCKNTIEESENKATCESCNEHYHVTCMGFLCQDLVNEQRLIWICSYCGNNNIAHRLFDKVCIPSHINRYQPLETVDEVFNDDVLLLPKQNDKQKKCRSKKSCLSPSDIQNKRLLDTTAPEITFCPCNVFVQAASCASSATASWDVPTATDASEPITAVSNFSPGDSFDVSTYLVIYYLIDNASFYSTCSFKVAVTSSGVVIDRENPILTSCLTDIVANASPGTSTPVVLWLAPEASNNSDSVSLTVNQLQGGSIAVGSTEVTYTTSTIYPGTDGTRPSFLNWPSNIDGTVPFGSSPTTVSWTEPIRVASIAAPQSSGSFFAMEYTNMVYTDTDPSGNFESCSFSVTVTGTIYPGTDGTRPSFLNWPSNINGTVPFGSSPTTVSWTEPIGFASVAAPQSSGSFFAVEYTNMVYTATDPSGNFESCSFSVTVTGTIYPGTDGTRPSFLNWPSNIDVTVPFGSSPTTVSWTEPIGFASVAAPQSSGSFFAVEYTNMPKI